MDNCPLCGNLLRIAGTKEYVKPDPSNSQQMIKVTEMIQICTNDKSPDNDEKPCPNYTSDMANPVVVNVIRHETVIPVVEG